MEPKYQTARVDDRDDRSSTTEVESLMEEQKWHDIELSTPTRPRRTLATRILSVFRSSINTLLLLTILALFLHEHYFNPDHDKHEKERLDFGGDMTGVGPHFRQQITTFSPDESYAPNDTAEFFTDAVLDKWNALMPKGIGMVWVNETEKYDNLPTPIRWSDKSKTVFTTSATHQLHCLYTIVQTYSGMTSGRTDELPNDHHWHMMHCFDYLRQAIMCNADMALEGLEHTFPDHNGGSDGWDAKHVCRDWTQVITYLESVRPNDYQKIF